jgi:hypothetical protein
MDDTTLVILFVLLVLFVYLTRCQCHKSRQTQYEGIDMDDWYYNDIPMRG